MNDTLESFFFVSGVLKNLFLVFLAYKAYQFIHSGPVLFSYVRVSVCSLVPSVGTSRFPNLFSKVPTAVIFFCSCL